MPATPLTAVQVGHKAVAVVPLAAAGTAMDAVNGNAVPNGGNTVLLLFNGDAADQTVTVDFAITPDGQPVDAWEFTIPAGTERALKLGSPATYGNPTTVTASSAAVRVRVLQL